MSAGRCCSNWSEIDQHCPIHSRPAWLPESLYPYIYVWGNNPVRAKLKGQRCRIIVKGSMNSVGLEFRDGYQTISSVRALRKATG